MLNQIKSLIERALPRVSSALVILTLAAFTNPHYVGIYNVVTLLYTAIQVTIDSGARFAVMRVLTEPGGMKIMNRYRAIMPLLAFVLLVGLMLIMRWRGTLENWHEFFQVLPVAFAPGFGALGLLYVGTLQATSQWGLLARLQLRASLAGLLVGGTVLVLTHSLLGPSLQLAVTEGVFALLCWWRARRNTHPIPHAEPGEQSILSDMGAMSGYALMAWFQGQAERLFMTFFAGTAVLGTYTAGSAVGRAPGDALAASTANMVRVGIADKQTAREIRETSERYLFGALLIAVVGVVVAQVASIVLVPLLGEKWTLAMSMVPFIAMVSFPGVLSWAASVLLVRTGSAWKTFVGPVIGIAFGAVIAWVASFDLHLAATVLVLREFTVVLVAYLFIGRAAPWRSFWLASGLSAVGLAACWLVVL
ncbi:hypothetical protein CWC38_04215 [Kocuria tytonicola]|uniref:Lipopolysaccharide biosynthesis protein n=1 Tax=Kocuria tytonicola TaxID=2055946 RepID=A0A3L9LY45_9MICC|nr:hypothetical protein [Kocuria tytonicola]RLY91582.1 hypothetical protein EAE32_10065 [Kocuria tytonicola]RLZ03722.1 hypothetical protein CWC38_04215 [Kocuria tytonicola]